MCLYINKEHIKTIKLPFSEKLQYYKSFIATEDIHVHKLLIKADDYGYYLTPYRLTKFYFSNGKAILKSKFSLREILEGKICKGIHSYEHLTQEKLERITSLCDVSFNGTVIRFKAYEAIIPKGTKYFKSVKIDGFTQYVSEKLIVYDNHFYNVEME